MKFIKFPQAKSEIFVPTLGPVPFYIEGRTSVVCLEFDAKDVYHLKRNGGKLFILGIVPPGEDRPTVFNPTLADPFITPKPPKNGFQIPGDTPSQGPSDDK